MIINASYRTDIPAFYGEWLSNRIREGYVCVRNPYYPEQITRYRLDPEVVDCIVFCTKNPAPMRSYMEQLRPFHPYFFVTATPYGREIEAKVPPFENVAEEIRYLSGMWGKDSVAWRYDPILLYGEYAAERHLEAYGRMAERLSGYVTECVISFVDIYEKCRRNFPDLREVGREDRILLAEGIIGKLARSNGIHVKCCAEEQDYSAYGIASEGCMTGRILERVTGNPFLNKKEKPDRIGCRCLPSRDIGAYHTCLNGCRYCYANEEPALAEKNYIKHDPHSPLLLGEIRSGERVQDAKQESYADRQLRLW